MLYVPPRTLNSPYIITVASPCAIGGLLAGVNSSDSGVAWPLASRAIFVPFSVSAPQLYHSGFVENGGTASGNFDIGIFDLAGNRLASCGSTAMVGTAAAQIQAFTADVTLSPGRYYMGLAYDNTTAQTRAITGTPALVLQLAGVQQMASAFPLPNPVTYANPASAYMPLFGILPASAL